MLAPYGATGGECVRTPTIQRPFPHVVVVDGADGRAREGAPVGLPNPFVQLARYIERAAGCRHRQQVDVVIVQTGKERAPGTLDLDVGAGRRARRGDRGDAVALDPHVHPFPVDLGLTQKERAHGPSWPSTASVSAPARGAGRLASRARGGCARKPLTSMRGPATEAAIGARAASMSHRPPTPSASSTAAAATRPARGSATAP